MNQTTLQKVLDNDSETKVFSSNAILNYSNINYFETLENFESLKEDDIILIGSFQDDRWLCNHKGTHRKVNIDFNRFKKYRELLLPIKTFATYIKHRKLEHRELGLSFSMGFFNKNSSSFANNNSSGYLGEAPTFFLLIFFHLNYCITY